MPDNSPNHSFIPKSSGEDANLLSRASSGAYTIVAVIILLAALVVGTGLFVYQYLLENRVDELQSELPALDDVLGPDLLAQFETASDQIAAAERLLDIHVAPSVIFGLLQENTAEDVSFSQFRYRSHQIEQGNDTLLTLEGLAPSFGAIAFQVDSLRNVDEVRSARATGLELADDGVTFTLEIAVDSEALLYKEQF